MVELAVATAPVPTLVSIIFSAGMLSVGVKPDSLVPANLVELLLVVEAAFFVALLLLIIDKMTANEVATAVNKNKIAKDNANALSRNLVFAII
jgi:hypothetical protein